MNGTPVFTQQYTRDALGRIAAKSETVAGSTSTFSYSYDDAGRLTDVTADGSPTAHYAYDENGNRLSRVTSSGTESATLDAQDRLLTYADATYTYNGNGELATKTDSTGTTSYNYDELGNLLDVLLPNGHRIDYVIDAENHRIGKRFDGVLVQRFLYGSALGPAAEIDANGNVVARFIYATHANVPDLIIKGDATYRVITDQLGSPRMVVNSDTGEVVEMIVCDEFGNVLSDSNPGFQPFGFAGGLYDADTRLLRFVTRDYEPGTGRWTAKDLLGFAGGDPTLYGYVSSDPVNNVDPTGLALHAEYVTIGQTDDLFLHSAIRIYDDADPNNDTTYSHGGMAAGAQKTTDFISRYDKSHEPIMTFPLNLSTDEVEHLQGTLAARFPHGIDDSEYNGAFNNCAQAADSAVRSVRKRKRPIVVVTTGDALIDLSSDGLIKLDHRVLSMGN